MALWTHSGQTAVFFTAFALAMLHGPWCEANSLWSDDCQMMLSGQSVFETTESVCVSGDVDYMSPLHVFFPSAYVFIVQNREWQNGDPLVDHYGDPTVITSVAGAGAFYSEVVQLPRLGPGEYDLVLDEDADGVYDAGYDVVVGGGLGYAFFVISDVIFSDDFESGDISGWSAMSCNNDPAPPGGSCPPRCTGGCPGNVCIIDCSFPSSCEQMTIDCPPGFACDVQCAGDSSCAEATINCPGNFSCNVSCTGVDSCLQATITCPISAPCDVLCSGPPSSCSATLQVCGLGNCQATCTGGQSVTTDCGGACSCLGCP